MDARPPTALLLLLVCLWQSSGVQPSYIIDTIGLTVLPGATVPSGTAVTLRCRVVVSHYRNVTLTYHFQFTRDDVPLHSATSREETAEYQLGPARAADSGSYECRVTVGNRSKSSFGLGLDVQGLQVPTLNVSKSTLYDSEEFAAVCSAPDEKGSLIFQFYERDGAGATRLLKQTGTSGASSETTLVLRKVGLFISPVMNVLYTLPDIYEGDILEVVCKVVNPPQGVEVFLTRGRQILKRAMVSLNHRLTAQEGDSGELVCKAQWGNVQKETYRTITVKSLFSQPRLTMEPRTIFEGESFRLTCSVTIFVPERISNETMRFSIFKDSVKVSALATYSAVARPGQNGNYSCRAMAPSLSPARGFQKDSQVIAVRAKIPVTEPTLAVLGGTLVLGRPFRLLCRSSSGTLPITYTLLGPDRRPASQVVRSPGEQAVFNTSALHRSSDISGLLCQAQNTKSPVNGSGETLLSSTRVIEPVSKPVLTLLPSSGDVAEGEALTLVCSVDRGTPPYDFSWHRSETPGALHSQTEERMKAWHVISAVRREDRGGYYCACSNPARQAKQSRTVRVGVKMAGWKKAVIAVICVLLVLALALALCPGPGLQKAPAALQEEEERARSVSGSLPGRPPHVPPRHADRVSPFRLRKSAGTKVERLSLTQAEVNQAANVTPGIMGRSVWSERTSGSESDDQAGERAPDRPRPQHPERQSDPHRGERQTGSVEYAQLNHDLGRPGFHGNAPEEVGERGEVPATPDPRA
ncbi:LOW QUALITY PROTEIN: platelet endothelial cell adhesion molecule [Neosynchiropus ocellatus]